MGRHSDPDRRWFWLSLAAAAAKAALAVALVGVAVFGLLRLLGGPADGEPDVAQAPPPTPVQTESTVGSATAEPADGDGGDGGEGRAGAIPSGRTPVVETATAQPTAQPAPGATVQVLNASGDAGALRQVVQALEELGLDVVAEGRASRGYERTTVLWSTGFQDEARALRDADPRFSVLERNDRLAPSINLHVVIGRDWEAAG